MKFRKKPIEVEAVLFDGHNFDAITAFTGIRAGFHHGELLINTMEGVMHASPGDWIIQGVKGEFYPCKPVIFDITYEKVV